MNRPFQIICAMFLIASCFQTSHANPGSEVFDPSFGNITAGASAFATAFYNYSVFQECVSDPDCGMPDDPGSGFEIGAGSCCDENNDCFNDFETHVDRIDRALATLYKNERTYALIMKIQSARMTAMRGAGGMSAPAAAVVARQEIDIAKAQSDFTDKFNNKTLSNISKLNDFMLELDLIIEDYCADTDWYQRNGLPLYLHARMKFPK